MSDWKIRKPPEGPTPIDMVSLRFEISAAAILNCDDRSHSMWKREFENRASRILRAGGKITGGMSAHNDSSVVVAYGPRHMVDGLMAYCYEFVDRWASPTEPQGEMDLRGRDG